MYCTRTRHFASAIVVLLCVVLTENPANAQPRLGTPGPGGMLGTLLTPKVLKEIGIQDDKELIAKLNELGDVILKERQQLRDATKGDQDQYPVEAIRNIDLKHRDELKKLLTAEQFQRLQQITWQQLGHAALTEPDVAEALKLTAEQIKNILAANRELAEQQKDYFGNVQRKEPKPAIEDILRDIDEFVAARDKKIAEILSPSQLTMFVEMQGKPFN